MARFKKLLRTTNSVEELLGLVDSAVKIALRQRCPHQWEWRELKETEGYRMNHVNHGNRVESVNLMSHVRFSGRSAENGFTFVALVLYVGDEYWHAPYGGDSYDNYGSQLAPAALRLYTENAKGKMLSPKRFFINGSGQVYDPEYPRITRHVK